jgi:hypothetical protein
MFSIVTKKAGESMSDHESDVLLEDKTFFQHKNAFFIPHESVGNFLQEGFEGAAAIDLAKHYALQFDWKNKLFVDVGARTGLWSVALAKEFKEVVAIEPNRRNYYALCGSVALSGLDTVHCIHQPKIQQPPKDLQTLLTSIPVSTQTIGLLRVDDSDNDEYTFLYFARELLVTSQRPPILFQTEAQKKPFIFSLLRDKTYGLEYQNIRSVPELADTYIATTK